MKIVLALAGKNGFTVETALAAPAELGNYDGAFLTSTSGKVMPIREVDAFRFPPVPDFIREIMKLYDDFLAECGGVFG